LSINRTTIFLSPTGAFSLVRPRFGRGQLKAAFQHDSASVPPGASGPDFAALQAAVAATGGAVEIVLSNHFVRYQLFPWQDGLQNLQEELGFARFAFTQTYGSAVDHWHIALSDEAPGLPRIAAAIDTALLERLRDEVGKAGGELVSVSTSLVSAVDYWRSSFDSHQPTWFLAYESGLLTLLLRDRNGWRWVRSRRVAEDGLDGWRQIIADETLMLGEELAGGRVLLFAPGCKLPAGPAQGGLVLVPLELGEMLARLALKDNRYAFAWVA
jgi:hypothetical protein